MIHRPLTTIFAAGLLLLGATFTNAAEVGFSDTAPTDGTPVIKTDRGYMVAYEVTLSEDPLVVFKMTPIPKGSFLMGSPEDEELRPDTGEGPQFTVNVDPFWMGTCEVTWDEYNLYLRVYDQFAAEPPKLDEKQFLDAVSIPTPQYEEGIEVMNNMGPQHLRPAVDMTQLAAKQYTKWLSKNMGSFYRLPSEAEWEYAARAGTKTAFSHSDDNDLTDYGWFFDNAEDKYQPVGTLKPNPWGLYDMHGNVSEWCIDQYIEDHYEQFAGKTVSWKEAIAWPSDVYPRVVKGGSWYDDADLLRSAGRQGSDENWKAKDPQIPVSIWWHTDAWWNGFRVMRPLNEPATEEEKNKWWKIDQENDWEYIHYELKHRRIPIPFTAE